MKQNPVYCILAIVFLTVFCRAAYPADLSREARLLDLATLWQEVNYNFVHFDLKPDLNWDRAFEEFTADVINAETPIEHIRVLQKFMALLGEGHTNVVPDNALWKTYAAKPPVELRLISGKPVVVNTEKSLAAKLPVGSIINKVDGIDTEDYLLKNVIPYISASTEPNRLSKAIQGVGEPAAGLLVGKAGTKVRIEFESPAGKKDSMELDRVDPKAELDWIHVPVEKYPVFELKWPATKIALIELNTFQTEKVVEEFEKRLHELSKADAVIIDVRKNGGGNSDYGWNIGSHFINAPVDATTWKTREHVSLYRALGGHKDSPYRAYWERRAWKNGELDTIKPREPVLSVPVAVLIGFDTYSAAEDFTAFAAAAPNFTLIGSPTAGSTGQPLVFKLPSGLGWCAITSKRDEMADGTRFVGRGIQPDIHVELTLEDFRAGRDPVLETAIKHLQSKL